MRHIRLRILRERLIFSVLLWICYEHDMQGTQRRTASRMTSWSLGTHSQYQGKKWLITLMSIWKRAEYLAWLRTGFSIPAHPTLFVPDRLMTNLSLTGWATRSKRCARPMRTSTRNPGVIWSRYWIRYSDFVHHLCITELLKYQKSPILRAFSFVYGADGNWTRVQELPHISDSTV